MSALTSLLLEKLLTPKPRRRTRGLVKPSSKKGIKACRKAVARKQHYTLTSNPAFATHSMRPNSGYHVCVLEYEATNEYVAPRCIKAGNNLAFKRWYHWASAKNVARGNHTVKVYDRSLNAVTLQYANAMQEYARFEQAVAAGANVG